MLDVGGFVAGTHVIAASYRGDIVDRSSGASLTLEAHDDQAGPVATTTAVSVVPAVISAGDSVSIHVHLVQTGTPTPPKGNNDVTLDANGMPLGQVSVDGNGDATLVVSGWIVGDYTIRASYLGTTYGKPSSATTVLERAARLGAHAHPAGGRRHQRQPTSTTTRRSRRR